MPRTVRAGTRAQLSSQGALRIAEPPLAVFSVGDRPYAIDDTCPHRGCSLADGSLEGTTLTCGCHGSQFDVTTGALVRGPATAGVRAFPARYEGDAAVVEVPDA